MIPADSDNITNDYQILLNELKKYNPEMLDKQRVLAITKSDMLDQELMDEIRQLDQSESSNDEIISKILSIINKLQNM